jgi:hypothetical protein
MFSIDSEFQKLILRREVTGTKVVIFSDSQTARIIFQYFPDYLMILNLAKRSSSCFCPAL